MDGFEKELNTNLSEVIGKTSVELDPAPQLSGEKKRILGIFLPMGLSPVSLAADIAIVNSGSIRSDAKYGPGDLSKKDVLTILPFENTLVKARLTGAHVKRLLEHGVSVAGQEDGRFPQVSGLAFAYDASKPWGRV